MGVYWGRQAYLKAKTLLGKPYVWGGEGTAGDDCSGLVQWAYGQEGITIARVTGDQCKEYPVTGPFSNGDLLFFRGSDGTATVPGHVGFFAGYGLILPGQHGWIGTGNPASGRLIILNAPYTLALYGIRFDYAAPLGPVMAHTRPGNAKADPK